MESPARSRRWTDPSAIRWSGGHDQELLNGRYERIRLFHVRLAFSDDMESVGKFALRKVWVLFTILRVWIARFKYGTPVLYYPPRPEHGARAA